MTQASAAAAAVEADLRDEWVSWLTRHLPCVPRADCSHEMSYYRRNRGRSMTARASLRESSVSDAEGCSHTAELAGKVRLSEASSGGCSL
eukprot:6015011-Pleurochrysis_carterae.AAC.1